MTSTTTNRIDVISRARALARSVVLTVALPLATLAVTPGCGGRTGTATVKYSVSAEQNYLKGVKQLGRKDWIAAAKYFSFIKARFPYSKFAVLAELRLADAEFGAKHYLQAIDSYKLFNKFHPTHEMVANGYASFRIGTAYFRMLPGDWWILPPSYEKDQSASYDADRELKKFLRQHPKSPFGPKAKTMLSKVNRKLARHEWYVATFYWERGRPMATVLRLTRLLKRYSGVGYDGEAMWLLGRAYVKVKMPDRARKVWERLVKEHPRHAKVTEAKRALRGLSG